MYTVAATQINPVIWFNYCKYNWVTIYRCVTVSQHTRDVFSSVEAREHLIAKIFCIGKFGERSRRPALLNTPQVSVAK